MHLKTTVAAAALLALGPSHAFADCRVRAPGTLLERLARHPVSRDMACDDLAYAARAYGRSFRGAIGRRFEWSRGPDRGYVFATREYWREGRFCRDFTQVVYRRGREFDANGTACRRFDGAWEFL